MYSVSPRRARFTTLAIRLKVVDAVVDASKVVESHTVLHQPDEALTHYAKESDGILRRFLRGSYPFNAVPSHTNSRELTAMTPPTSPPALCRSSVPLFLPLIRLPSTDPDTHIISKVHCLGDVCDTKMRMDSGVLINPAAHPGLHRGVPSVAEFSRVVAEVFGRPS